MQNRFSISFTFTVILGSISSAQQPVFPSMSMSGTGDTMTVTFRGAARPLMVVTGNPYSADQISEHTQTLADGTHITQNNTTQHLFRDPQGRTRTERSLMMGQMGFSGQNGASPLVIEIADPVASVGYILDEQNKVAHRVPMETRRPALGATSLPPPPPVSGSVGGGRGIGTGGGVGGAQPPIRPENSNEKLGTQTIEGVIAEGTRHTTTWPIGSQGNDRPMTDTSETWYSQELRMMVLSKSTSARSGDNITRLTNISRAEPNPGLFQPPPDYTVVDDKDSVTMTLKRQ